VAGADSARLAIPSSCFRFMMKCTTKDQKVVLLERQQGKAISHAREHREDHTDGQLLELRCDAFSAC
jgi:hypothetical protein